MTRPPCRRGGGDCPLRKIGCHAGCAEYRAWCAERSKRRLALWIAREADEVAILGAIRRQRRR